MPTPYRRNARTPAGRISATPSTANWGGLRGLLSQYPGAAAAYSLRSIGSGPVVQLRRASDSDEKDFTAAEIVPGTEGAELVTNGDFATDSDWNKGTGWSITGGEAVCDGTQVSLSQLAQIQVGNDLIASGLTYGVMTFTVSACSDFGSAGFRIATNSSFYKFDNLGIGTAGTYTLMFAIGSTANRFNFFAEAGVTMTLDDVSCKTYTPSAAEEWSFVASGGYGRQDTDSAYVRRWYDQSGNGNDAGQSTARAQPKLITAGVVNTVNGEPSIVFDGSNDFLNGSQVPFKTSEWSAYTVITPNTVGAGQGLMESVDAGSTLKRVAFYWATLASPDIVVNYAPDGSDRRAQNLTDKTSGQQYLSTAIYDSASVTPYLNGAVQTSVAATGLSTADLDTFNIGKQSQGPLFGDGDVQEIIIYPSDQSANRVGIETNINAHYGIY